MNTVLANPVIASHAARSRLRLMSLATLALTAAALLAAAPPVQAQAAGADQATQHAAEHATQHATRHASHHRMGPGMAGDPMMSGRLLDAVGASAAQKAQVQEILKTAHDDMRQQHAGDRELRQQLLALVAAPQVDAAAAEGVRQKLQARHDAASKRRLQAMLDAGAVLTPEQRLKVAERLTSRHNMMERHHRERQAAEPRS